MDAVTIIFGLAIYLLPAGVAATRHHKNTGAITALNIFAGWTVVGWIGAFIWALTSNVAAERQTSKPQKTCPDCGELVLATARKCKHCGTALVPDGVPLTNGTRLCPDCHRPAPVGDKYCPACGHAMAPS